MSKTKIKAAMVASMLLVSFSSSQDFPGSDEAALMNQVDTFLSESHSRQEKLDLAERVLTNRAKRRRKRKERKLAQYEAQHRDLGEMMDEWKTMKLVVQGDTQAYRRIQPSGLLRRIPQETLPNGANNVFAQGDILVGGRCESETTCTNFDNNNIYRRSNPNVPIGVSFQTCITPTMPGKGINQWLCTFVLAFSDMISNQVMAQGNYYRASVLTVNNWAPQYQFLAITGGTGIFRGVTGFIILSPRDLGMRPGSTQENLNTPEFWYYLVYKLF